MRRVGGARAEELTEHDRKLRFGRVWDLKQDRRADDDSDY